MDRQPISVLHVDDHPNLAETVARFVEHADDRIDIQSASNADEARSHLEDNAVDCIVSDYDMPGQNGLEFLRSIRETRPELPFILYTGKGSEAVASDAISAGVTDYMQKEMGTDQYTVLANRIANAVTQYRAEREAKRTRQRLEELTESTTDCRWMFSSDLDELLFISGYEAVWDRPTASIREDPQDFLKSVHPDDRDFVERVLERVTSGEPFDVEYRIIRGDETTGWVWAKGEPIFDDGEVVRVVGLTRDITERKQRNQDLERTRERISFTLDSIDAGIWELDPNTDGITCIPDGCPVLDSEIDTVEEFFEKIHPDDRPRVERAVQTATETAEPASVEVRPSDDVNAEWIEIRIKSVTDDASDPVLIGLTRDVSDRKEREPTLQRERE